MKYTLIYKVADPKKQWIYVPSVNDGCYVYSSLAHEYESMSHRRSSSTFHDIESYMRYAEQLNGLPTGSLRYDQQLDLPYEYW